MCRSKVFGYNLKDFIVRIHQGIRLCLVWARRQSVHDVVKVQAGEARGARVAHGHAGQHVPDLSEGPGRGRRAQDGACGVL